MRRSVRLEFSCCLCGNDMTVSMLCEGVGLTTGDPVAGVPIECPECGVGNYLVFSPLEDTIFEVIRMQNCKHSTCLN